MNNNNSAEYSFEVYVRNTENIFEFSISLTENELNNILTLVSEKAEAKTYMGAGNHVIAELDATTANELFDKVASDIIDSNYHFCDNTENFVLDSANCA